ncbi:cation transporter [Paenibacillus sp. 598K]|uniref:cation diffusion facilitator family transporter n=1 Tax=Paenibacillus sp. 598K TaxID=1117987 RepID=UPI000FF97EAF|nr:cation diffusion facilitator family transporter [Paenibacillus sp. 598K]GBF76163.1 cation transporter [Paenibacillus sp. 598K]
MHNHNHAHDHSHGHTNNKKVLLFSFLIITIYMIVEAVGGYVTNSLALLSDAGHMLSDSVALGIALLAMIFGQKAANRGKTYGYRRFEMLAALLNGITLIGISGYIFYEAISRLSHPPEVATTGMLIISSIGLFVNLLVAWMMMRGGDTEHNLNMRGAYLHVISDMLGSVGAIVAALLMIFFGWGWADIAASVIVAALVLRSGYQVTRSSIHVLMEGAPAGVELDALLQQIRSVPGVRGIHDVHIWTITSSQHAFTAHIEVDGGLTLDETSAMREEIEHRLAHEDIQHVVLQFESSSHTHDRSLLCTIRGGAVHAHSH